MALAIVDYSEDTAINDPFQDAFGILYPSNKSPQLTLETPLQESAFLSDWFGVPVWLKRDDLQFTGSFKVRGSGVFLTRNLPEGVRPYDVTAVAASHGNHAQGVLHAANVLGVGNTVLVLPLTEETPEVKIRACLQSGAMVILQGKNLAASMQIARQIQTGHANFDDAVFLPGQISYSEILTCIGLGKTVVLKGPPNAKKSLKPGELQNIQAEIRHELDKIQATGLRLFVPTYDHPDVIAGQGTQATEVLIQNPAFSSAFTYIVPAGGLGLLAGIGNVLSQLSPRAQTWGVNDESVPAAARAVDFKERTVWDSEINAPETGRYADGTDVPDIGKFSTADVINNKSKIALVSADEIAEGIVFAAHYCLQTGQYSDQNILEGAAVLPVVALLNGAINLNGKNPVVLGLTGKNLDPKTLERAKKEKGWVAHDLNLYRFVTAVRTAIRKEVESTKTSMEPQETRGAQQAAIGLWNTWLKNKDFLNKLQLASFQYGSSLQTLIPKMIERVVANGCYETLDPPFELLPNPLRVGEALPLGLKSMDVSELPDQARAWLESQGNARGFGTANVVHILDKNKKPLTVFYAANRLFYKEGHLSIEECENANQALGRSVSKFYQNWETTLPPGILPYSTDEKGNPTPDVWYLHRQQDFPDTQFELNFTAIQELRNHVLREQCPLLHQPKLTKNQMPQLANDLRGLATTLVGMPKAYAVNGATRLNNCHQQLSSGKPLTGKFIPSPRPSMPPRHSTPPRGR